MVDAALRTTAKTAQDDTTPRIDVDAVGDLLLGTWADTRREAREMIKDPAFWRDDSLGKDEHRERVLTQLHLLVENNAVHRAFPKRLGGEENNGGNIAGFEELVVATRACRSSRACSGGSSDPPCCSSAPRSTTTSGCPAS